MNTNMPSSSDEAIDNMTQNAWEATRKAGQAAGKAVKELGKATKKLLKKPTKAAAKAVGRAAKEAAKAVARAAAHAVQAAAQAVAHAVASVVSFLVSNPVGWVIDVVLIIILIVCICIYEYNHQEARDGDGLRDSNGNLIEIMQDWDKRLISSYYLALADHSYWYTIGDSTELIQGNLNSKKQLDKNKRENNFTLTSTLIRYLDEKLNTNFVYGSQFIKPVYNTCATGESQNGYCYSKDLVGKTVYKDDGTIDEDKSKDAGNLLAMSTLFERVSEGPKAGENLYQIQLTEDKKDIEKTAGVWDYGFAPVLHYVKNEDEWSVRNLRIQKIEYWDEAKKEYIACKPTDCDKELVKTVEKQVENKLNMEKYNVEKFDNYLIDNVATFLGTITSEIEMTEKDSGNDYYEEGLVDGQYETRYLKPFKGEQGDEAGTTRTRDLLAALKRNDTDSWLKILRDPTIKKYIHVVRVTEKQTPPSYDIAYRWYENNKVKDSDGKEVKYRDLLTRDDEFYYRPTESKGYREFTKVFMPMRPYKQDSFAENFMEWKASTFHDIDYVQKNIGVYNRVVEYDDAALSNQMISCNNMDIVEGIPQEDGSLYTGNGQGFFVCKDIEDAYQYTYITSDNSYTQTGEWSKDNVDGLLVEMFGNWIEPQYTKYSWYYLISYELTHPTKYTLEGDYWEKTYDYVDGSFKIKDINNGQYIYDYINNYEVYIPEDQYVVTLQDYLDYVDEMIALSDEDIELEYAGEDEDDIEMLKEKTNKYRNLLANMYGERIWEQNYDFSIEEYCSTEAGQNSERCQVSNDDIDEELITEGYGIQRNSDVDANTIAARIRDYHNEDFHTNDVQSAFKSAAVKYGITDVEILYAISWYETGITDGFGFDSSGNITNNTKAGIMGLNYDMYKGTHRIFDTSGNDLVRVTPSTLKSAKSGAISITAARLRELINHYQGNILMAIQAYGQSQEAVDYAIKQTAENLDKEESEIMADFEDLTWSNFVFLSKFDGDPLYLANVLQYYFCPNPSGEMSWLGWNESETSYTGNKHLNINNLYYYSQGNGMTLDQQLNWSINKKTIESNFKFLYNLPGEPYEIDFAYKNLWETSKSLEDSSGLQHNPVSSIVGNNGTVYNSYYVKGAETNISSDFSVNSVIAQFLASTDNGLISDYTEITEDMWLEKFNQMFGSLKADDTDYKRKDYGDYFKEYPSSPLKGNFVIIRPFGFSEPILNSQNIYTRVKHTNIVMMGEKETKVYPVASGVVDSISGSSVTIKHPERNNDDAHTTYTIYGELAVDETLYVGQAVTNATVLGVIENDMSEDTTVAKHLYEVADSDGSTKLGYITIELIHDDIIEDPTWIIQLAKALHEDAYGQINHAAQGLSLESARRMQEYILEHVDEIEAEFEDLSLEAGETFEANTLTVSDVIGEGSIAQILGIAWTYSGAAGDTAHEGIDISPYGTNKKKTEIVTFAKSLLIAFYDGFADNGYVGSKDNWGAANYIIYMVKDTNGNWYQFDFLHCQQNQEIHLSGYEQTPVLEKGTFLGMVGNSGSSSGYHTHLQIHFLGHMSLKDIIETDIKNFNKFYMLSWGQDAKRNPNHRCENNGYTAPCYIKPHAFLNATYYHSYSGKQKVLFSNISSYIPNDQIDNFDGTF